MTVHAPQHRCFEFTALGVEGRRLRLGYRLGGGPDPDVEFEEQLILPAGLPPPNPGEPRVAALLSIVHRTFGVSYFKVCCPQAVRAQPADEALAAYCDLLYSEGLGELYFRHGFDPRGRVRFPRRSGGPSSVCLGPRPARKDASSPPERVLLLVGGGKDSVVAREIVRHATVSAVAFSLGTAPFIERSAAAMGLPHLVVERRLDPALFDLNARGALNGHVPISACIAACAVLCAELGAFDGVVAANERSADEGNASWKGVTINHQWSKSSAFEQAFAALLEATMLEPPRYFSLLRPLSELAITRLFLGYPQYFDVVSSCNKNYRLAPRGPTERWCGACPKCLFVYLMMAVHAKQATLDRIFGRDLLAAPSALRLLAEMTGVSGKKPFECVGTFEETRAALGVLEHAGRLPPAVAAFWHGVRNTFGQNYDVLFHEAMTPGDQASLPALWRERMDAYLRSR